MLVANAVIMAAGTSSRFAPLSYERHKGLTVVRGEVLIERQIRQLLEAGVGQVYIVTGYKAEQFDYLPGKFGVRLEDCGVVTADGYRPFTRYSHELRVVGA